MNDFMLRLSILGGMSGGELACHVREMFVIHRSPFLYLLPLEFCIRFTELILRVFIHFRRSELEHELIRMDIC